MRFHKHEETRLINVIYWGFSVSALIEKKGTQECMMSKKVCSENPGKTGNHTHFLISCFLSVEKCFSSSEWNLSLLECLEINNHNSNSWKGHAGKYLGKHNISTYGKFDIVQLKYTNVEVSNIRVPEGQIFFLEK